MRKRIAKFIALALAVCLASPAAEAYTTNSDGDLMVRVGLASSSSHVPTPELPSANLENNNSAGYGEGFRFGRYDDALNFVELGRTGADTIAVSVLKTQNLYYNGKTYTEGGSGILVGCYHIRVPGEFGSYDEAAGTASNYENGFVAWIDGEYQVRVGAFASKEDAQSALDGLSIEGGEIVGTSSYGMTVVKTKTDRVLFQYDEGASGKLAIQPDVTGVGETRTWFDGFKYRGGFEYFRRGGGNLTVVNVLPVEDYVNGVICYEMGREWPLEALKAQAMCARTYMLKSLNKHGSYGFDICTSSNCQVYHGMGSSRSDVGPTKVSMQAVEETAGLVVKYKGKLAETPYSSSMGGSSENAKYIWGTDTVNTAPYLQGVADDFEKDLEPFYNSPWKVTYSASQLTKLLQDKGYGRGTSLGELELQYSDLGNVIKVVAHWTNGQTNTFSPSDGSRSIRTVFGVNSIRFTVTTQGGVVTPDDEFYINGAEVDGLDGSYIITGDGSVAEIPDDVYVISGSGSVSEVGGAQTSSGNRQEGNTVYVSGDSYIFDGAGWGHQVGMSQFGANAMARRGHTYDEIIQHYFPGVTIESY